MFKKIIFDFDGTLANTLDVIVDITNRFSSEFGYEKITKNRLKQLQNLNSREIIKTSNIPLVKIPILLHMVKHELNHNIQDIKPIAGIEPILNQLIAMEYQLGIVSSNSEENIRKFIQKNQWERLFEIICCSTTIFGKAQVLKKLLKTQNISAEEVIYVGDETRDIDAAKAVNIKAIAVSWGFNSRSVLAEHDPDFLIDRPEELLQALSRL